MGHTHCKILTAILFFCFVITPLDMHASESKFVSNLAEKAKILLKKNKVKKANSIFADYFNMKVFTKRCLVDHINEFSQNELDDFINLFDIKIRKNMSEKFLFKDKYKIIKLKNKTTSNDLNTGIIKTHNTLILDDKIVNLNLYLIKTKKSYQIVDFEVEGALLSRNYRGQFNYIIRHYGKEELFNRLKNQ